MHVEGGGAFSACVMAVAVAVASVASSVAVRDGSGERRGVVSAPLVAVVSQPGHHPTPHPPLLPPPIPTPSTTSLCQLCQSLHTPPRATRRKQYHRHTHVQPPPSIARTPGPTRSCGECAPRRKPAPRVAHQRVCAGVCGGDGARSHRELPTGTQTHPHQRLPHGHGRPAAPADLCPAATSPRRLPQSLDLARQHAPRSACLARSRPRSCARARPCEEGQGQKGGRSLGAAEADPSQDCPARARPGGRQGAGARNRCVSPSLATPRPPAWLPGHLHLTSPTAG